MQRDWGSVALDSKESVSLQDLLWDKTRLVVRDFGMDPEEEFMQAKFKVIYGFRPIR